MPPRRDVTLASSIGSMLKKLRHAKPPRGLTQKKCAEEFGVPQSRWSEWESGYKTPSDLTQKDLAEFFGVPISALRGETTEPPINQCSGCSTKDVKITELTQRLSEISIRLEISEEERNRLKIENDQLRERIGAATALLEKSASTMPPRASGSA